MAKRLGFTAEKTALGMLDIVTANMVRAIRTVSVERGHDPRDYVLMPFGGAGPLHASPPLPAALGIKEVLVPESPGILCAQGLLVSDLKEDFVRSRRVPLDSKGLKQVRPGAQRADARCVADWFKRETVEPSGRSTDLVLDMRYVGQNFELQVSAGRVTGDRAPEVPPLDELHERFFAAHEQYYGFFNPDDPVEVVNVRLTARGALTYAGAAEASRKSKSAGKPAAKRPVWFDETGPIATPVYDRSTLAVGQRIKGPAIVTQLDSTTVIYPGDRLSVDAARNLLIEIAS